MQKTKMSRMMRIYDKKEQKEIRVMSKFVTLDNGEDTMEFFSCSDESDFEDDPSFFRHSERMMCTPCDACNGQGEFCPLHHHCSDGMDCPDYHCCGVHKCRSYETVRDRLRNKMRQKERLKREQRKKEDKRRKEMGIKDDASIDELLAFINGESNSNQQSKSKKKKKKKKRKKSKSNEDLSTSLQKLTVQDEKKAEKEETKQKKSERSKDKKKNNSKKSEPTKQKKKGGKKVDLKKQLEKGMDFSALFDESKFEDDIDQDQDEELKAFQKRLAGDAPLW